MYVVVELNAAPAAAAPWGYVRRLGHALIQETKIEIGGSKIDEQYGDWLNVWYELSHKVGQERGYAKMIGDVPELNDVNARAKNAYTMYVPLQFWFNKNNGLNC
jgi:hypothetical protein